MNVQERLARRNAKLTTRVASLEELEGFFLTIEEEDGTPLVINVKKIRVSNGTLTDSGDGTVVISTSDAGDMSEGPGIDIVGQTVGLGGDTILLYDSGGSPVAEFAATGAGLDAATAAATSGDVVWLPAGSIADDHVLLAGVHYIGASRWATVLTGQITLGVETTLEYLSITRTANDASDLKGVIAPTATGSGRLCNCSIACTQSGSGDAYAIAVEAAGGIVSWMSYLEGTSSAGNGYGGYRGAGCGNLYVFGGWVLGTTDPFNE